jgi:hypothetical protein
MDASISLRAQSSRAKSAHAGIFTLERFGVVSRAFNTFVSHSSGFRFRRANSTDIKSGVVVVFLLRHEIVLATMLLLFN